jgi:hypothetical protein
MKPGVKIFASYGFLVLLSLLFGAATIIQILRSKNRITTIVRDHLPGMERSIETERLSRDAIYDSQLYALSENEQFFDKGITNILRHFSIANWPETTSRTRWRIFPQTGYSSGRPRREVTISPPGWYSLPAP